MIVELCIDFPESRHLIARFRFNHMVTTVWMQTFIPILRKAYPYGGYKIDDVYKIITLPNGASVWGAGLDDKERVEKIMGTEFASIFINEGTQIGYDTYQKVKTRLSQNIPGLNRKIAIDCNPRNESHWIYRYFIANKDPITNKPLSEEQRAQKIVRKWLPHENPHLSADYLQILAGLSGTERQRLFEGQWVNQEGLIYPHYHDAIIEPFEIPRNWEISGAVDFGYTNPFAFLWFAFDRLNEIYYLIDEYYEREKTVKTHCEELARRRCEWIVADHDAEDRETMAENGLPTIAAQKDIETGIQAVHELLRQDKPGLKLKIFSSCINTIEELSVYSWALPKEGQNAKEVPIKHMDHAMDALRYWAKQAPEMMIKNEFVVNTSWA